MFIGKFRLLSIIILFIKVIALTIILLICYFLAAIVSGLSSTLVKAGTQGTPASAELSLLSIFLVFLLPTAVITIIILRSRWYGWKLMFAVFLAFYGVNTVLAQIESAIFLPEILPEGMVLKLFIMGAIMAGMFTPLAVVLLGKMKGVRDISQSESLRTLLKNLPIKLAIVSLVYMLLYFVSGYFVAWKSPLLQDFYGAKNAGNFFVQLVWIWRNTPWMFAFQAFRGLLFALFALPTIRMLKGPSWQAGLATGMLIIIWSGQLILPNLYISAEVARIHLIESVPYHFVFGFFTGFLLSRSGAS
jgi:hypothetical protein